VASELQVAGQVIVSVCIFHVRDYSKNIYSEDCQTHFIQVHVGPFCI